MNVEYTGRQFEITPAARKQIESGLEKLKKHLGANFQTHVILSTEKHRSIAEITVAVRNHAPIVGLHQANDMSVAMSAALDKIERQAVKYKTRWKSKKHKARKLRRQPRMCRADTGGAGQSQSLWPSWNRRRCWRSAFRRASRLLALFRLSARSVYRPAFGCQRFIFT